MAQRLLVLTGLLAAAFGAAWADDPAENKTDAAPAVKKDDLVIKKQVDAQKFRELQQALLRLAQRLESSAKPEDRERAGNIRKAIELASTSGVDTKFDRLIGILKTSKDLNLDEIDTALKENQGLVTDIRAILAILLSDNRDERRKAEILRLQELIKQLSKAIRDEKVIRSRTEGGRTEKQDLIDAERKNRDQVAKIGRAMDGKDTKDSDQKKGQGKGKSQGKGKGKGKGQGQGQGQSGDKKDDGKQQANNRPQPPSDSTPGRKQVQEAENFQKKAIDELSKEDREKASQQQSKAIEELEKARKKLEEILRQLREEEIERILAALQARCQQMLQMQIAVYNGTVQVDKAFKQDSNKDSESNRGNVQKAIDLAKREGQIVEIANKAIQILETEGSAVAFPEVFHQVRDDMKAVERRLGKADTGTVTQVTEQDIINTLKDMIEALKKAQKGGGGGGGGGGKSNQSLIDVLAELKMIRAMQVRINGRTRTYAEQYKGEQAAAPDIQKELTNLAERQFKIYEVTNNIARGKNK
jgi:hypothetical protein